MRKVIAEVSYLQVTATPHVNVTENELAAMKEQDGRRFKLSEVLTKDAIEGFRRAILTFVVGGCILRITGAAKGLSPKKLRYSFLVHSEASRGSHNWQEKVVGALHEKLVAEAAEGTELFTKLVKDAYDDLAVSIRLYGKPLPGLPEVHEAVKAALAGKHLTISKVNSDEEIIAMLDNSGQLKLRSPLNVFIGGQVLDRGVTLANMIGFYYGRRPNKISARYGATTLAHVRVSPGGFGRNAVLYERVYTAGDIRDGGV